MCADPWLSGSSCWPHCCGSQGRLLGGRPEVIVDVLNRDWLRTGGMAMELRPTELQYHPDLYLIRLEHAQQARRKRYLRDAHLIGGLSRLDCAAKKDS
jgi:hypothetical protein